MNVIKFSQKIIFVLLIIMFHFPIFSCKQGSNGTIEAKTPEENSIQQIQDGRIIKVYYFHTTYRCSSCIKIEELTKRALNNNFTQQLKSGRIVFQSVNVEEKQNEHFVQDYQLFTKSVVLVDLIKGKQKNWKRLDQTWNYIRDAGAFDKYIKGEIIAFVKK